MVKDGRRLGVEVKRADAPTLTPSMRIALEDLRLERLVVLYPGSISYQLSPRVSVVPLAELAGSGGGVLFRPPRRSGAAARNSRL